MQIESKIVIINLISHSGLIKIGKKLVSSNLQLISTDCKSNSGVHTSMLCSGDVISNYAL